MPWPSNLAIIAAAAAAAAIGSPAPSLADEAYLCGPDKVVYVSAADLPLKKRTDPCIAAYYGLSIESSEPGAAAGANKNAHSNDAQPVARSTEAQLRPLSDKDAPELRDQRHAALDTAPAMPKAMRGTDYRNVKILNAGDPGGAWFLHTK
jgi:hypothetical protein